ncbi:MAG: FtsX-like permease family protein [Candidatus Thorarchaeota archaeon]
MAAQPAGYEAFHSLRRKSITLVCFLLASTMAIGITVYVDSYSVHEWEKNIDVGDVAITVSGRNIESYIDEIRDIRGVTRAAGLFRQHGSLINMDEPSIYFEVWGEIIAPDENLLETFPNYVNLELGRLPENDSEIALIHSLQIYYELELGDILGLQHYEDPQNLTVVGFYSHEGQATSPYFWDFESIAIVVPSIIEDSNREAKIFVDVVRTSLSAFNPTASLQYLDRIDESIRRLDPTYIPGVNWPDFSVQNRLSSGVSAYISFVQMLRFSELLRASSVLFLLVLVNFLAIRHNVNERRYEENMLISRGAAKSDLERSTTREILILAILSCFIGIPLGLLLSRIAIAATGFFTFNLALFFTEPILISLESLLISGIVAIALPMLTLVGYRMVYSTKKSVDEDRGKLAKLSKGLGLLRWDIFIVGISGLFLIALTTGGSAIASNPILSLILPLLPIPLFLGISSLSIKVLRWKAYGLSKAMRRIVGDIPSSIGIRRVGKGASSAGAAAMILVLAICLSWNSAIIDASMPITAQNQSRLSVGSDLTIALDENEFESWNDFITNVTNHELVVSGTIVSETYLFLSAGYEGGTNFFAVNPREYKQIGYDYLGNPLNESGLVSLLDNLESSPDGAIITSDIAQSYDFAVGDILRASTLEDGAIPLTFRIIGITEALPEVPGRNTYWIDTPYYGGFTYYYSTHYVGTQRILVNREYLGSQLTLLNSSSNFFCVRTTPDANASIIVEDVFDLGGEIAVYHEIWESVSQNVQDYVSNTQYMMERSLDTMLTVLTVGTIVGGFTIYAFEGVRARKREIALLRSVGASKRLVILAQAAEMMVLMLFSMVLLLVYSPLFLSTSINMAGTSTTGWSDIYAISVFPVIPWNTIFVVLGFFVACVAMFIFVIAALSSRINLASTLNAAWAEAGPYGGDM